MKRTILFIILLIPPIIIPLIAPDEQAIIQWFLIYVAVVIPTATIWRMKSLGHTSSDILKSFIPFYGLRKRFEIFTRR